MSFLVRTARVEDVPGIVAWTSDTFDWGDYVPERLPGWLADPNSHVVVCVDHNDTPIAISHTTMVSPTEAWLEGARVHPEHRRSGLGSAMNQEGTRWARERGARIARLATESSNEPARHQVENLGYRVRSAWTVSWLELPAPRLDDHLRLKASPSADIESAWMSWSVGDLAGSGKELISHGWRWRTARPQDLIAAAGRGEFFQCPAGWVILEQPETSALRAGWLATTPDDAPLIVSAILDLATERDVSSLTLFVPSVPWMDETLIRAGGSSVETLIYSMTL